jgi:hypothetical protein
MSASEEEKQTTSETADILSVVALVISIIYSTDPYDAWDVGLGVLVLVLCSRRLWLIHDDHIFSSPRIMARLGIALVVYVFIALLTPALMRVVSPFGVLLGNLPEAADVVMVAILFVLATLIDLWLLSRTR